jgi:hypothetical protein
LDALATDPDIFPTLCRPCFERWRGGASEEEPAAPEPVDERDVKAYDKLLEICKTRDAILEYDTKTIRAVLKVITPLQFAKIVKNLREGNDMFFFFGADLDYDQKQKIRALVHGEDVSVDRGKQLLGYYSDLLGL